MYVHNVCVYIYIERERERERERAREREREAPLQLLGNRLGFRPFEFLFQACGVSRRRLKKTQQKTLALKIPKSLFGRLGRLRCRYFANSAGICSLGSG